MAPSQHPALCAGTVLVRASEPALLSARSAARDSAIQQALPSAHGETLPDRVVLCVHLLLEASKRDSSQWWPYLRSLPTEYTTLGAFPADLAQEFQVRWCSGQSTAWMLCQPLSDCTMRSLAELADAVATRFTAVDSNTNSPRCELR